MHPLMDMEIKPHILIVPSLGMGHLIPFVEIGKRLASLNAFSLIFITTNCNLSPRQIPYAQDRLRSHSHDIRFVELPEIHIEPQKMAPVVMRTRVAEKSCGFLESLLGDFLASALPICAFVTDMFNTAFLDVTAKLGIPSYLFVSSSASFLNFMFHLPVLDSQYDASFKDMDTPLEVPGLGMMDPRDVPSSVLDRSHEVYGCFLTNCCNLRKPRGILINTFQELEESAIETLEKGVGNPAMYPVGPIISFSAENPETSCLQWLDRQPPRSVIFVSFGSEATLSEAQIAKLARGLEASEQRFLWVLRASLGSNPAGLLPPGFESRNEGKGLVVHGWAPQVSVLSHPSTAAFVSHCGWNSTLESLWCGVPMVAWPVMAEQGMNRNFMVETGAAVRVHMEADGAVAEEEVERAVREVMQGEHCEKARRRMEELQKSAKSAVDQGGNSYESLLRVVCVWKENTAVL
uniref:Glycosyltransferase n=1 Tax=Araucaria cunninghamii TaxID=56994 RepID=A0A0D6QYJ7_ARACU